MVSKAYANRSTDGTTGQSVSGAGPNRVVTFDPSGLSTGPSGQEAAIAFSSEKAASVPAPLEYRTASVDSAVWPAWSTATTWRRAVRWVSLG
jgi:hypothetical protein